MRAGWRSRLAIALLSLGLVGGARPAQAMVEPAACGTVRLADVGWTDISATTALAGELLDGLGYRSEVKLLSVPVTFRAMANRQVDVFLGSWMPSMRADIAPYLADGRIDTVRANLVGAKYTLAVPDYVYQAGVRSIADLARYRERFGGRIYGIEAGNDGNRLIAAMIRDNAQGLAGFRLVESSEAGMLAQVRRAVAARQWVVFLGWAPHPMNRQLALQYLAGGDAYFGPNYGGATVHTTVRGGYLDACRNVGRLLRNLAFTVGQESLLMGAILDDRLSPREAARRWLRGNPAALDAWLAGVTTRNGAPAVPALRARLATGS